MAASQTSIWAYISSFGFTSARLDYYSLAVVTLYALTALSHANLSNLVERLLEPCTLALW